MSVQAFNASHNVYAIVCVVESVPPATIPKIKLIPCTIEV